MSYVVIIEQGPTSFGASVPELPGVFAIGPTREDVEQRIRAAIELHLAGLREDGLAPQAPA